MIVTSVPSVASFASPGSRSRHRLASGASISPAAYEANAWCLEVALERILFLRVDPDMLARLDAIVERERAEHPGRTVTRAGVVREMLLRELERKGD